jgi:protein-tyrosine phosphatase
MIDLHTHILPGIDDGVREEDEAVAFARMAQEDGIRTIVATPHCKEGVYFNTNKEIFPAVERLRKRLSEESVDVELLPGAEVHICPDLVERIRSGLAPTIADNGKTLLLELSLSQPPVELPELLFQLKLAGIVVLFAHPERIRYFRDDVSRYEQLVQMGAWGQLTSGSLLGKFGRDIQKLSEDMLVGGLVHVLASDAHNIRGRPPLIHESMRRAAELVGEEYANAMVTLAPQALLEGRAVQMPAIQRPARMSFFGRWFGRKP